MLGLTGVETGERFVSGMVRRGQVSGSGKGIMDAGPPCAVGHEGLPEVIGLVAPWIDQAVGKDLEFVGVGIENPDTAFSQASNTPWGFNVGVNVYGLGEANPAVLGMAETMDDVVGVFRAQT